MHHEQNIFKMGGLRKLLPITYGLMWLGSLALAGIPPFAGFFSKDLILESAFAAPNGAGMPLYMLGTLAAALTAVYGFRIIFMSFHGPLPHTAEHHVEDVKHAKRARKTGNIETLKHIQNDPHAHGHADHHTPHESPWMMIIPMLPLGLGAVLSGYLLSNMGTLEWWQGAIVIDHAHNALHASHHIPEFAKMLPLLLAICGITLAYYLFAERRDIPRKIAHTFTLGYAISLNKWYIDELYNFVWVKPTHALARALAEYGDKRTIDGLLNGGAATVRDFGQWLRLGQTGYVYHYGLTMLIAITIGLGYLLWTIM
jgi:NADH-quinone oxidoreductase subunit L